MAGGPQRIVCLTAETTEIAFAVGAGDRVVGVSGYAIRPPEARKKPKVAAFQTAHVERIPALEPDLVLGFSDLQAEIARELIRAGVAVLITNQRTLAETAQAMRLIGAACGEPAAGEALAAQFEAALEAVAARPTRPERRPRVYFEEWDDPLISGIAWVSELIERCGGEDIFPELRGCRAARQRVVDPAEVARRDPEIIIASWCGKKARLERIAARPGWERVSAVRDGRLHEIKSPDILAPGPSLLHGARQLAAVLDGVTGAA
ncbi:cobalamin-binding protein [Tepidiforma flava]|uniref:Cobalamin-binding protein n=1 Tax=Tepidiforma flava TaxID=3004094 RepID=A0ABY7M963_9CHLR|nr:cobalamin-binding protein [Tepidiforma flava]WBL36221.1 cobalamin-binding protein [Tepidiforma flava]